MKRIIFTKQKECLFLDVYAKTIGLIYDPEENPFAREVLAAAVLLTFALREICIPTYPAAPEKNAPIKKPIAEYKSNINQIKN